ncbi:MAG: hypothetical protein FJY99_00805 [Candidatus Sericytochromatia bacterium]|nr:hypothetical protein [Candidatus Tanganyikabacteria bacterium]
MESGRALVDARGLLRALARQVESGSCSETAWLACLSEYVAGDLGYYGSDGLRRPEPWPHREGNCPDGVPDPSDGWTLLPLADGNQLAVRPVAKGDDAGCVLDFVRVVVSLIRQRTPDQGDQVLNADNLWEFGGKMLARGAFGFPSLTPLLVLACRMLGATEALVLTQTGDGPPELLVQSGTARWIPSDQTRGRPVTPWLRSVIEGGKTCLTRGPAALLEHLPEMTCPEPVGQTMWHPFRPLGACAGFLLVIWPDDANLAAAGNRWLKNLVDLLQLAFDQGAVAHQLQVARAFQRTQDAQAATRHLFVRQLLHDMRNEVHALALVTDEINHFSPEQWSRDTTEALHRQVRCLSGYLGQIGKSWQDGVSWGEDQGTAIEAIKDLAVELAGDIEVVAPVALQQVMVLCQPAVARDLMNLLVQAIRALVPGTGLRLTILGGNGWITLSLESAGVRLPLREDGLMRLAPRHFGPGSVAAVQMLEDHAVAHGLQVGVRLHPGHEARVHLALRSETWGQ